MFTGLINTIGHVGRISTLGDGLEMEIKTPPKYSDNIKMGDSICINGVCSTAVSISKTGIVVQYLKETLLKTTMGSLSVHDSVNLELCLTLNTKLGGHLVSGHVDDTGKITDLITHDPWTIMNISYASEWAHCLIPKGSIAIDGISLTIVDLSDHSFSCHLIPHTTATTNLSQKKIGDAVNLEFDQIGKYIHRIMTTLSPSIGSPPPSI
jgi:riboflavin synthase